MVQKKSNAPPPASPRPRGRPRAYRPELALAQARDAFWRDGFAATSLDDLSAATGMNRPSLYAAFGDKQALYVKAYASYRAEVRETFRPLLLAEAPLREKLRRILVRHVLVHLEQVVGRLDRHGDQLLHPELEFHEALAQQRLRLVVAEEEIAIGIGCRRKGGWYLVIEHRRNVMPPVERECGALKTISW